MNASLNTNKSSSAHDIYRLSKIVVLATEIINTSGVYIRLICTSIKT